MIYNNSHPIWWTLLFPTWDEEHQMLFVIITSASPPIFTIPAIGTSVTSTLSSASASGSLSRFVIPNLSLVVIVWLCLWGLIHKAMCKFAWFRSSAFVLWCVDVLFKLNVWVFLELNFVYHYYFFFCFSFSFLVRDVNADFKICRNVASVTVFFALRIGFLVAGALGVVLVTLFWAKEHQIRNRYPTLLLYI